MSDRLEFVVDDDRLTGFAGALPVRLLAERAGLRAGLSAAMCSSSSWENPAPSRRSSIRRRYRPGIRATA